MADLSNPNAVRPVAHTPSSSSSISTKFRANRTRLGRSQSQSIVPLSSRYPSQIEQRPLFLQESVDVPFSHFESLNPSSSTTTALMMINKQYSPRTTASPISNGSPATKHVPFYEKRHCNFA